MPLPQDHLRAANALLVVSPPVLGRVPDQDAAFVDPPGQGCVASQMLIGKEEDLLPSRRAPLGSDSLRRLDVRGAEPCSGGERLRPSGWGVEGEDSEGVFS